MTLIRALTTVVLFTVLAAEALPSCVTLTWTAPGDDGDEGQAVRYDLRYAEFPITAYNWEDATCVSYCPPPLFSGSLQSCTVTGLVNGRSYWFAIKARDDFGNWSGMSNVVRRVAPEISSCVDVRGNVDCSPDESVNGLDLAMLLGHLFIDMQPLCCPGEANLDGDPAGSVDGCDLSVLISHLFIELRPLPSCR